MNTTCHVTAWSQDGFGHQLAGALSCEALGLAMPDRYRYVPSRHSVLEHAPTDPGALLDLINMPHTPSPVEVPVPLPARNYQAACSGERNIWPPGRHRLRPTSDSEPVVCDNCWGQLALETRPEVRLEMARRVRSRLRTVMSKGGELVDGMCSRRYDICAHIRGADPAHLNCGNMSAAACAAGERDSVRRRSHPPSWWRRAIRVAAADAALTMPPKVLVHTNDEKLAEGIFAATHEIRNASVDIQGRTTSLLRVLADLIFCCERLVIMHTTLASVAVLATIAKASYSATGFDMEFGLQLKAVSCGAIRATAALTDEQCKALANQNPRVG